MAINRTIILDNNDILEESFFEKLTYWGLCSLLFLSPFFKGLFFPGNQWVALLVATILFLFASIISYQKKELRFFSQPLDYLMLALPTAYIIATLNAANYALAVDEVLENILYFFVFWTAVRIIRTPKHIVKTLVVLFVTGFFVSLVGLFAASGWLDIKDAYLLRDGGTIASVFQYKNTLASFLTAISFIGFYLMGVYNDKIKNLLLGYGTFLLLIAFFATQSHGGYIIFGIFTSLLWLLYPDDKRFAIIFGNLLLIPLAFIASKIFLINLINGNLFIGWLGVLVGIIVLPLYQWVIKKHAPNIALKPLLGLLLVIFLGGMTLLFAMGMIDVLLEKLHMFGAMERATMYEDSLKMIQQKPLIGWGGGGWSEAYTMFQSYAYNVRQMHSFFIQVTIEAGLLGLLTVVAIWGLFLKLAYRVFRMDEQFQSLVATITCAILAILAHSFIDFNLSLAALTIIMFTLVACLVRLDLNLNKKSNEEKVHTYSGYSLVTSILASIIIFVGSLMLISSNNLYHAATDAINARQGQEALQLAEQAISMNPLEAKNYNLAAQLYSAFQNHTLAAENADKALKRAFLNPDRYIEASVIYLRAGQNQKAVTTAKRAVQLAPLKVKYYEQYTDTLVSAAIKELQTGKTKQAVNYLQETLATPKIMDDVLKAADPEKKKLWIYAQPLAVTDKIKLNIGIAYLIEGNTDQAAPKIIEAAQSQELKKEALLWQAILAQKQGDNPRAENLLKSAEMDTPDIKKRFDEIVALIAS